MPNFREMQAAILVSVVVPTLNRDDAVRNTVCELLSGQSPFFLELIVVDQSNYPSALAKHEDKRLFYRHVTFKNLPKAKNYGASIARGDVVLFLDDDVACVRRVVEAHALAHIRTGASVVTGPILGRGETFVRVDSLPAAERAKLHAGLLINPNLDTEYTPLFAPGGNASYKKEVITALGGFDENFLGSAVGEDAEMSHRVKAHGGKIVYDPAASLVHLYAPMGGCRDERDEIVADEARVLNAHYLVHKTG